MTAAVADYGLPSPLPERVMVITAHPDDVDFGAAGTVAAFTDAGVEVVYCIVTDGDAGGFDPTVPRSAIAGIRREEQTRAAKEVGVERLHFLGYPDGLLEANLDLRKALSRVIRMERPNIVFIQSPVRNLKRLFASHPDHIAAAEAAICAVYPDARNPFTFTDLIEVEGLEAWTVAQVWIMGGAESDKAVDITDQIDRKIRALMNHESQFTDPDGVAERVRGWNKVNAQTMGLPDGRSAEIFQVVETG